MTVVTVVHCLRHHFTAVTTTTTPLSPSSLHAVITSPLSPLSPRSPLPPLSPRHWNISPEIVRVCVRVCGGGGWGCGVELMWVAVGHLRGGGTEEGAKPGYDTFSCAFLKIEFSVKNRCTGTTSPRSPRLPRSPRWLSRVGPGFRCLVKGSFVPGKRTPPPVTVVFARNFRLTYTTVTGANCDKGDSDR
jgi:hypothetical protein